MDVGNLLHQNFTDLDINESKAEIVQNRTFDAIKAEKRFMTAADFPNYDVVFSCVDSMTFRKDLYNYGWAHPELYWIDGRCSSRNIGLFNSKCTKKNLLSTLSESTERRGCLLQMDKEKKTAHITPVIVASMMAQSFLNHIRGEDTPDQIMLYI